MMRLLHAVGGKGCIAVLASLKRLHEEYGRATVRAIAADIGRNEATVHYHLKNLRDLGLVDWADKAQGTLHPTCEWRSVA